MSTLRLFSDLMIQIAPAITFLTVFIALWQIRIAKNALVTSSKREAVTLAADKCKEAAEELIPLHTQLTTKQIICFWELTDNKSCDINLVKHIEAMNWFEAMRKNIDSFSSLVNFANKIESFAMYFANGAADEQIAYPAMGETFCNWVKCIAPVIVGMKKLNNCTSYYSNTISLYKIWSPRRANDKICEEITKSNAKKQELTDNSIKPLGT